MKKILLTLVSIVFLYNAAEAQCNTTSLADSIHVCVADTATIGTTLSGTDTVLSITWTPATGLSSTTILNPVVTGVFSARYRIVIQNLTPTNLVTNGDFEAGPTGFTSDYSYVTGPGTLVPDMTYAITTNPFFEGAPVPSVTMADHTTGAGNMMAVNGATTAGKAVWQQGPISVIPFTDYFFSVWVANWNTADVGAAAPSLQLKINGIAIGAPINITTGAGGWSRIGVVWNSTGSIFANPEIDDVNTSSLGNDFALDDIWLRQICYTRDSTYVDVQAPTNVKVVVDTAVCASAGTVTLRTTEPGFRTHLWISGSPATSITGLTLSGTYWVINTDRCKTVVDTFHLTILDVPTVSLGLDTGFCIGNSLDLTSPQPGGYDYLWSTGATSNTITVNTTGTYWLRVDDISMTATDTVHCFSTDTIHVVVSPYPIVNLGPDTFNCVGTPVVLQSSVSYPTGTTYLWNDLSSGPTLTASSTSTYWEKVTVAGCASSDTINVAVIWDTLVKKNIFNHDTTVCRGMGFQPLRNVNPMATVQWLPTAGIANPTVPSPVFLPDTSATYHLIVSIPGCPDLYDTVNVDVQPYPEVHITGNTTVCQFDTLHLHATVSPGWYNHYHYSWTPPTVLFDDSTAATIVLTAADVVNSKVFVTVSTPWGCSGADSTFIVVHPGNFDTFTQSFNICPRDSVQFLPNTVFGTATYVWHPGIYLSDSTSATPWVHATTSQTYYAVAKSQDGCLDTITTSVTVRPAGHIFLGDSVTLYPGESFHIKPQTNLVNFVWFPSAGLDYPYISDPTAQPLVNTKYKVSGTTEWGCRAEDSISIYFNIESLLAIPNAFTPGGSVNKTLMLIKRGEASLNYYRVFNQWGNMVFETKNISEGWDGTFHGKPQPFGVYVYEIEAVSTTGAIFRRHGNVTLVR